MSHNNIAPQVITRILREVRDLSRKPADGIAYVDNTENSVAEIHAIITGPEGTPFAKGKFRMKLVLSNDYPASPPRGFFLTKIYHPNVANNGDICVNTLKKDWSPETTLKHVLQVIRCLLIVPFPESSLNDEAGKLFMDSYEEFARRARLMTEVHALDELEENDEKDDNSVEAEKDGEQEEAGSVKVGADGVKSDGAGDNVFSSLSSGNDVVEEGSSSTKSTSSSTKSTKDKKRDAKKKSLKRL